MNPTPQRRLLIAMAGAALAIFLMLALPDWLGSQRGGAQERAVVQTLQQTLQEQQTSLDRLERERSAVEAELEAMRERLESLERESEELETRLEEQTGS